MQQTQSFTFFFTQDHHRATDRSEQPLWRLPKASSSTAVTAFGWK